MKLYLAKQTAGDIERLKQHLPHALLLVGPVGVGLRAIALDIAGKGLSGIVHPTDIKGEIDETSSGVIRISQIRELSRHVMSKTRTERVYVIDNADQMNSSTQNAFLKLLEEPAPHVHFILVTHHVENLLATVRSRAQQVTIPTIEETRSLQLLDELAVTDPTTRAQLLFLAGGLPAEIVRLVNDKPGFQDKAASVTAARQLLQGTMLEKLKVISDVSTNRARTLSMLTYAQKILAHSLAQNPSVTLIEHAARVTDAYDRIAANGHIKAQLSDLVV